MGNHHSVSKPNPPSSSLPAAPLPTRRTRKGSPVGGQAQRGSATGEKGEKADSSNNHSRPSPNPSTPDSADAAPKGCDNLHCLKNGPPGGAGEEDEDKWSWCRDRIIKGQGQYKPWFPMFFDRIVSLPASEVNGDMDLLHQTQPPIFRVGTRVAVVYDDGYRYPGAIVAALNKAANSYRIRLDEGTQFITTLPDNDVDILDGPYRTKSKGSMLRANTGKRQRVATSRLNT